MIAQKQAPQSDPTYSRYPMLMKHPAFKPAEVTPIEGNDPVSGRPFKDYQGTSVRFPPVTVNDEMQEEYHKSQGYEPAGTPSPGAYQAAMVQAPPANYQPQEYPKWVDGVLVEGAPEQPLEIVIAETPQTTGEVIKLTNAADLEAKEAENEALKARIAELEAEAQRRKGGRPKRTV